MRGIEENPLKKIFVSEKMPDLTCRLHLCMYVCMYVGMYVGARKVSKNCPGGVVYILSAIVSA
jgi:hypothetical protein